MKTLLLLTLLLTSSTSATFYNIKPHKLYKHLVEPLIDVAVRSIVTGSVIDPIGQFIGGGGKHFKQHHKKKYHQGGGGYAVPPLPLPYPYYHHQPGYYHERDVLLNYAGGHVGVGCAHHGGGADGFVYPPLEGHLAYEGFDGHG